MKLFLKIQLYMVASVLGILGFFRFLDHLPEGYPEIALMICLWMLLSLCFYKMTR